MILIIIIILIIFDYTTKHPQTSFTRSHTKNIVELRKQAQKDRRHTYLDITNQETWCCAFNRDEWREDVKRAMSYDVSA